MKHKRSYRFRESSTNELRFEQLEQRIALACDATISEGWHTNGGDVGQSGYVAGSIGTQFDGEIKWEREMSGGDKVIHDGLLYSLGGGLLKAIDLETGSDVWEKRIGGYGNITFDNGNLYFFANQYDAAAIYSVSASTGETNWFNFAGGRGEHRNSVVVVNGLVYDSTNFGIWVHSAEDGELVYHIRSSSRLLDQSFASFYEGRLFTFMDGVFAERVPDTGEVIWSLEFELRRTTVQWSIGPVISNGIALIYLSKSDFENNGYHQIDIDRRQIVRTTQNFGSRLVLPALADRSQFISLGGSAVEYPLPPYKIKYYRPTDRQSVSPQISQQSRQPIITDDAILTPDGYIFDRASGDLMHVLPVGGKIIMGNNFLVVQSGTAVRVFSLCGGGKPVVVEAPNSVYETDGEFEVKLSIASKLDDDLAVRLHQSIPGLFRLPDEVVIPAKRTSITVPIKILNNEALNVARTIELSASAVGFEESTDKVIVYDDELATPTLITGDWQALSAGATRSGYIAGHLGTFLPDEYLWWERLSSSALTAGDDLLLDAGLNRALSISTGEVLWQSRIAVSTYTYLDGDLFATSSRGHLYSLDVATGELKWASEALAGVGEISVDDNWIYVPTGKQVYRIDRETGRTESRFYARGTRSTLSGDVLLVGKGNGISAVDPISGSILWRTLASKRFANVSMRIAARSGLVVFRSDNGLRALDVSTGTEIWTFDAPPGLLSPVAINNEHVFVAEGGILRVLDLASGELEDSIDLGFTPTGQPIVTDDAIILGGKRATFVVDRSTRQVDGRYFPADKVQLTDRFIVTEGIYGTGVAPLFAESEVKLTVPQLIEGAVEVDAVVEIPEPVDVDLVVSIVSDLRGRLDLPSSITIAKGSRLAVFSVKVFDDNTRNEKSAGYVMVSVPSFHTDSVQVEIKDNDIDIAGNISGVWPAEAGGPSRSSYVPGTIGDTPRREKLWELQIATSRGISITHEKTGFTFVRPTSPGDDDQLLAFDTETGATLFRRSFDGSRTKFLAASDRRVFLAGGADKSLEIYALSAVDGHTVWSYSKTFDGRVGVEGGVVSDGVVLLSLGRDGLLGVSQDTGGLLFHSEFESSDKWAPSIHDGRVFVSDLHSLREFDIATGALRWAHEFADGSSPISVPAAMLEGSTAVIISGKFPSYHLVAFDVDLQTVRWIKQGNFNGVAAIADGKVFAIERNLLRVFHLDSGEQEKVYVLPSTARHIIVTDDAVILSSVLETYALSRASGSVIRSYEQKGQLSVEGKTLIITSGHSLSAVSIAGPVSSGLDVNGDGHVSPIDALQIVNHLNSTTAPYTSRFDLNLDGWITPIDVLMVVNWLNAPRGGEGESSAWQAPVPSTDKNSSIDFYFGFADEEEERFGIPSSRDSMSQIP